MTVHHVRLLHGSAPNTSARARLICFYECTAADAWPLAGSSTAIAGLDQRQVREWIRSRTLHGEPTVSPRLEHVRILLPLPPAPDSSSIFKIQKSAGAGSAFGTVAPEVALGGAEQAA
jgi:hypothetical protein